MDIYEIKNEIKIFYYLIYCLFIVISYVFCLFLFYSSDCSCVCLFLLLCLSLNYYYTIKRNKYEIVLLLIFLSLIIIIIIADVTLMSSHHFLLPWTIINIQYTKELFVLLLLLPCYPCKSACTCTPENTIKRKTEKKQTNKQQVHP